MKDVLIRLSQVSLTLGGREILKNVDLALEPATITSLIGPNGAGKTSLVKLVLGLSTPSSGHIQRQAGLRIGYMPQKLVLNTSLPITVQRFLNAANGARQTIDWALEQAGAGHLRHTSMHGLSGGETQRVLLARSLLCKPQLLVLDEPAQGVDINGQQSLYQRISDIRGTLHCAVLLVSHDLHWVMAQTDSVICLNQHICCHGHPSTVSDDPAYRELFGNSPALIAPYHHEHDHTHTIHGDVAEEGCCHD